MYCNSITAATIGDKEDEDYDFYHDLDGGFGGTNNADKINHYMDKSEVHEGDTNEFDVVNNHEDLVDDEVPELVETSVPDFNFADILSSLIKKVEDSEAREDQVEDVGEIRERLYQYINSTTTRRRFE